MFEAADEVTVPRVNYGGIGASQLLRPPQTRTFKSELRKMRLSNEGRLVSTNRPVLCALTTYREKSREKVSSDRIELIRSYEQRSVL